MQNSARFAYVKQNLGVHLVKPFSTAAGHTKCLTGKTTGLCYSSISFVYIHVIKLESGN